MFSALEEKEKTVVVDAMEEKQYSYLNCYCFYT